ncbi:prepilin-type N-terminal cleavage/methylation domain-containing protein [Candidatus Peregrinibacteria bacterium]|nr:MAG: prepilin-type N-terminal cleavage/methylation domain-containing protein [Candidatus Peregrinibacteria bacterium]
MMFAMMTVRFLRAGFSLVELLVVMAIIGILYTTTTLGLRGFGDQLNLEEVGHFLTALVGQQQLRLLNETIDQIVIEFQPDYLILSEHAASPLQWSVLGVCPEGHLLSLSTAAGGAPPADTVVLRRNEKGQTFNETLVGQTLCVSKFTSSTDRLWELQAIAGTETSDLVRLMHFNVDRRSRLGRIQILNANGQKAELTRELNTKRYFDELGNPVAQLDLSLNAANSAARLANDLIITLR